MKLHLPNRVSGCLLRGSGLASVTSSVRGVVWRRTTPTSRVLSSSSGLIVYTSRGKWVWACRHSSVLSAYVRHVSPASLQQWYSNRLWCGYKLLPDHAHPSCLQSCLGRQPIMVAVFSPGPFSKAPYAFTVSLTLMWEGNHLRWLQTLHRPHPLAKL